MTRRGVFVLFLLIAVSACAVYIWPTRYRTLDIPAGSDRSAMRVDRFNGRVEQLASDGRWIEYSPPLPDYDVRLDSGTGRAVGRTLQAGEDIRKMNEVAKKATEK